MHDVLLTAHATHQQSKPISALGLGTSQQIPVAATPLDKDWGLDHPMVHH